MALCVDGEFLRPVGGAGVHGKVVRAPECFMHKAQLCLRPSLAENAAKAASPDAATLADLIAFRKRVRFGPVVTYASESVAPPDMGGEEALEALKEPAVEVQKEPAEPDSALEIAPVQRFTHRRTRSVGCSLLLS
mmetsp:Transcript_92120/g.214115  ORF Transcript_92120/g.214115 Transcript_92120/m.214115 type:complete len:135 (+) Transcript_92120:71-475(+)